MQPPSILCLSLLKAPLFATRVSLPRNAREREGTETGKPLPEGHFKRGFGRKNEFIIPELLRWATEPAEIRRLSLRKEALYRELVAEWGLEPLPGVRTWLERLRAAGVPCAIGSSTHRANIDLNWDIAAAIDRLVHHCVILELNIPSYRVEQAKKAKADSNAE